MRIEVKGINLYYEKSGAGAPLILLHGNGEDHHIFDVMTAKLQKHFTVYAIDSRNHGQSDKTADYSYEAMAEDVYAFIEELGLAPVGLVGFSDGAIIGLMLAVKHSSVLDKMALLGVNLSPDDFTEEGYRWVEDIYQETKDSLFRLMLEQPQIGLNEVAQVEVPTLLVAGEDDIFKPESFIKLEAALPNASLVVMEGHDHDSYITGKDILYPALLKFFR